MTTLAARPARRRSGPAPPAALRPLAAPSLAHALVERLSAEILSGQLAPGARLPTEQDLIATTGVSRTVVREAIAGLAAERTSAADLREIAAAHAAIGRAIERGESAIDQDFAFHRSIAEATRNPQFPRFLEYLGRFIIPRQTIRVASGAAERLAYLRTIQKEHLAILRAIRAS